MKRLFTTTDAKSPPEERGISDFINDDADETGPSQPNGEEAKEAIQQNPSIF
jgi:hypothetical protein